MSPYEPVPQHVDAVVQPALAGPQMGAISRHEHQYPRRGLPEVLWRRRLIVVFVLLLSAAGGYIYLRQATPIYEARARLLVEPPVPFPGDPMPGPRTVNLNNECQLMSSGRVLADALNAPGIRELRTFTGAIDPLGILARNLSIAPGKNDDLITVSFESPYREDVHLVANAVAEAYKAYKDEQKKGTAAEMLRAWRADKVRREAEGEEA